MSFRSIGIGLALVAVAMGVFGTACGGDDDGDVITLTYEGSGMEPNVSHGDEVKVKEYGVGVPARGDMVVFRSPTSAAPERYFLKRVIGMPGETIEMRDRELWVDGRPLEEPYIMEPAAYTYGPEIVSDGHYFVLGDNRNNSSDSHIFGPIPSENIIGYVVD